MVIKSSASNDIICVWLPINVWIKSSALTYMICVQLSINDFMFIPHTQIILIMTMFIPNTQIILIMTVYTKYTNYPYNDCLCLYQIHKLSLHVLVSQWHCYCCQSWLGWPVNQTQIKTVTQTQKCFIWPLYITGNITLNIHILLSMSWVRQTPIRT